MNSENKYDWKTHNWFFSSNIMDYHFGYELIVWILTILGFLGWIVYSNIYLGELVELIGMVCFVPFLVFNIWRLRR